MMLFLRGSYEGDEMEVGDIHGMKVPRKPFLKACGITRLEDGLAACAAGFAALGFVFAPSPRRVEPDRARAIAGRLPSSVLRVGVFLDQEEDEVRSIAEFCSLDLVQLHGSSSLELASLFGSRAIPALRPRRLEDLELLSMCSGVFAVLVDTWDPRLPGGTGKVGNWELATVAAQRMRVILAGGLNPGNVGKAIAAVRPFGVDVSSGVERSPGVKDHRLLDEFTRVAQEAFRSIREGGDD